MRFENVIPGLPTLSKNLAVRHVAGASNSGGRERDLDLYDCKARDSYKKTVEEARLKESTELKSPDPLVVCLVQVCWNTIIYGFKISFNI